MKDDSQVEFLPFHAINEFMRPDFRLIVIRRTLAELPNLPSQHLNLINKLTRKLVKVPGFRNSEKAPAVVKILPMSKSFEKSAELVAAVLSAWAEAHSKLRSQVYSLLEKRGWLTFPSLSDITELSIPKSEKEWGILPPESDRTKMPGFLMHWPKGEDFEILYQTYADLFPDENYGIDEVSLMAVWLSMRLPYKITNDEVIDDLKAS